MQKEILADFSLWDKSFTRSYHIHIPWKSPSNSAWQWPPLVSEVYRLTGMSLSRKVFFSAPFNRAQHSSPHSTPLISDLTLSWANTSSIPWAGSLTGGGRPPSRGCRADHQSSAQEVSTAAALPSHSRHCRKPLQTGLALSNHEYTITSCSQKQGTGIRKQN